MTATLHKLQLKEKAERSSPSAGKDRTSILYEALRRAIIERAVHTGAALPEDTIATGFDARLAEMTGSTAPARYVGEIAWRCGLS